jgi:hypothetical protein
MDIGDIPTFQNGHTLSGEEQLWRFTVADLPPRHPKVPIMQDLAERIQQKLKT